MSGGPIGRSRDESAQFVRTDSIQRERVEPVIGLDAKARNLCLHRRYRAALYGDIHDR